MRNIKKDIPWSRRTRRDLKRKAYLERKIKKYQKILAYPIIILIVWFISLFFI